MKLAIIQQMQPYFPVKDKELQPLCSDFLFDARHNTSLNEALWVSGLDGQRALILIQPVSSGFGR